MRTILSRDKARQLNPLNLAFIGDSVWESFVRDSIFPEYSGHSASVLHQVSVSYVRAEAQSDALAGILDLLTEEEMSTFKRGRNQKSHVPKNALQADYRRATGFEALLGFLYLTGQDVRLEEIMSLGFRVLKEGRVLADPNEKGSEDKD